MSKTFLRQNYPLVAIVLTALLVANVFILNFFDGGNLADGSKLFYQGHTPYDAVGYLNPPHSAIFAVVTIGGKVINAFCNAALLFLLLGGKKLNYLLVFLSPFFVISIGEGNIFYVTAAGLLILLARQKGVLRGVAWALLTCRPQDAALVAVADGIAALRERDYKAFITSALFIIPPLAIYGADWMRAIRDVNGQPQEYTLSVRENWGIPFALAYFGVLVLLRMSFSIRPPRRPEWRILSIPERYWLLMIAGWVFLSPYVTVYMIIYALLPLRTFDLRKRAHLVRAGLLYTGLIILFGAFFVDPRGFEHDQWQLGFLFIPLWIAVVTPKDLTPSEFDPAGEIRV